MSLISLVSVRFLAHSLVSRSLRTINEHNEQDGLSEQSMATCNDHDVEDDCADMAKNWRER